MHRRTRFLAFVPLLAMLAAAAHGQAVVWSPHAAYQGRQVNLGPTGARGWVHDQTIYVVAVQKGSPAEGVLAPGDAILGVNGRRFPKDEDPRVVLGNAITKSETEARGGRLDLLVQRDGKEESRTVRIRVMGSYSPTWPFACAKSARILREACAHLAVRQYPDGHVQGELGMDTMWAGPLLLASGEAKYLENARRAAYWLTAQDYATVGLNSWPAGYGGLCVAEYYLATGDRSVLPWLERLAKVLAAGQMRCGSWGHSAPWGGYGAVNQVGLTCMIALILTRECGVAVDDAAIQRSADFFRRYVDKGWVPYGDHPPWVGRSGNGKNALAAAAFELLGGEPEAVRYFARTVAASHPYREDGHTGSYFSFFWGPLAAIHAGDTALRTLLDHQTWYYDLARTWDGGVVNLPNPENLGGRTPGHYTWCGTRHTTGGMALFYALPGRRLRILGAPRSVFGASVPAPVAAARMLYDQRKWKELEAALARLAPDHKRFAGQLATAARLQRESVACALRDFHSSIAEGDAYRASELLKSLERRIGKDNPQLAAPQKLMAANEQWVEEGSKYYAAWSTLRDYTWQYWHYYGHRATDLLADVAPRAPRIWEPLVATAETEPQSWKAFQWGEAGAEPPAEDPAWAKVDGWQKSGFDDAAWDTLEAPLRNSRGKQPGWNSRHILLRRSFTLDAPAPSHLLLLLKNGKEYASDVYLNGVLVARVVRGEHPRRYARVPLADQAAALLKQGENLIAVHCRKDAAGGRLLDVGLLGARPR